MGDFQGEMPRDSWIHLGEVRLAGVGLGLLSNGVTETQE